ncbi:MULTISPECIES: DUF892 family protein [Mesorhizobium]|uniref:DUF892 family protein n=1 Tax=Mesorhizobium sp. WSM3873 TaxID=1854056 RepID=UPI001FD9F08A|nr:MULTISPECIES: DUF892 family protein [Mesorhizobium]
MRNPPSDLDGGTITASGGKSPGRVVTQNHSLRPLFLPANSSAEDHFKETKGQLTKIEQVFKSTGKKTSGEKYDVIEGPRLEVGGPILECRLAGGLPGG